MKMKDLFKDTEKNFRQAEPTFENKLFYAQLTPADSQFIDSKYGFLDGASECLESYKPVEELEEYIDNFEQTHGKLDEYERAYVSAYRSYIKQEKTKEVTNE